VFSLRCWTLFNLAYYKGYNFLIYRHQDSLARVTYYNITVTRGKTQFKSWASISSKIRSQPSILGFIAIGRFFFKAEPPVFFGVIWAVDLRGYFCPFNHQSRWMIATWRPLIGPFDKPYGNNNILFPPMGFWHVAASDWPI
jgi:hypothetical protein